MMADAVKDVADVVADGATDHVTGATAPVVSEEDEAEASVVAAQAASNHTPLTSYFLHLTSDESHSVDFSNLLALLGDKFHSNLRLALKHFCRNVERLVLELRDAVFARVVD